MGFLDSVFRLGFLHTMFSSCLLFFSHLSQLWLRNVKFMSLCSFLLVGWLPVDLRALVEFSLYRLVRI